jgi:hypothetical protein
VECTERHLDPARPDEGVPRVRHHAVVQDDHVTRLPGLADCYLVIDGEYPAHEIIRDLAAIAKLDVTGKAPAP